MATKRISSGGSKKTSAPKRVRSGAKAEAEGVEVELGRPAEAAPVVDHEAVARRAYELFVGRGMTHGHDLDDWLAAERQLTGA